MQFSESWLRSFVNPSLSSEELAHLLTMAGLEVEQSESVAPAFDKVVVAQVLSKEKHPDADRLNVLTVDVGQPEPLTIVCGAQNVSVGMKAPCALVGATLPGNFNIKQAKVRGVASWGMMCSENELGLAAESNGLMALSSDAQTGQSIRQHLDLDDHLITLKLTPNRSDCLSIYGIAREVSALTGTALHPLPQTGFKPGIQTVRKVKVTDSAACPRYFGRVIENVNATAPTPKWMVQRLERCGLRSISALVDVTNYVLLELGQPLHAFDLNKLNGDIEVRFARAGEMLILLNDQHVTLQTDMLVIADNTGPRALAGVMGGQDSAVSDTTASIFLESAFFTPGVIVGKPRQLGLGSDSAFRFERGVDFAATQTALDRATLLIIDICGGQAGPLTESTAELPPRQAVKLRVSRVQRVLGVPLQAEVIAQILARLGMLAELNGDAFNVTPPSYRFDIAIEEDLIEEVARVYGYEHIQPLPPQAVMTLLPHDESQRSLSKLRRMLVLRDYQEVINFAFVETQWERDLCGNNSPVALKNPIASQMSVMRSSLLGGLLQGLRTNLDRKQPRVRLFEMGACFYADAGKYVQHNRLAGLAYGTALPEQWGTPARNIDFYDVKGDVEALFAPATVCFVAAAHPASHPGRSAKILLGDRPVGWIGELHPQWQQGYDLPQSVVWFELEQAALTMTTVSRAGEISKFPTVRRDIAVVVDDLAPVQLLLDALLVEKAANVVEIGLFDLYRGKGVEPGKKSLAFRVLLQDTKKTLTDAEIDPSVAHLIEVLQKNGAQLRV
jgi:phenylalanyl-tRNA synthetase beta chain